jgi:hypothetical protein
LAPDDINLSFKEGMLFARMERFLEGSSPACMLFSGPYCFAEQLGLRKILACSFMIAAMITGNPNLEDVRKYYRALNRAQQDIDLRHERYTHYYEREFPTRFHDRMDTRRWGPGGASCSSLTLKKYSTRAENGSVDATFSREAISGSARTPTPL